MKNLFLILFFSQSYFAFGQVKFPVNGKGEIEYTEVVNIDSTSADKLYSRAKMSIAEMFKSAQNVIQNDDATNKLILIKGNIQADYNYNFNIGHCNGLVNFTMTLFCKDNRYKYSLIPSFHECSGCNFNCSGGDLLNEKPACGGMSMTKAKWDEIRTKVNSDFFVFIESLKKKMAVDVNGGDEW
jgi:hypothetical protein